MKEDRDKITDSRVLMDMITTELRKYHKMLIEQGHEGHEKVDELIGILEDENNSNRERVRDP